MKELSDIAWKDFPVAERWLNRLRQFVASSQIVAAPGYLVNRGMQGTTLQILPRGRGGDAQAFECVPVGALSVLPKGGNIIWQDQLITVADGSVISVTPSASNFRIWLSLDSTFAATTASFSSGTAGWSGYPAQPYPPARTHILLADFAADSTTITGRTLYWNGGDIVWPTVFAFWK